MEPIKSLLPPGFSFRSDPNGDAPAVGTLEIYIHHARNIHNICIYANQDVYAKFSLTSNPDDTVCTRIVDGGGKNPQFDERLKLSLAIPHAGAAAVLKCEIWMLSRVRRFLEDQLLGFALVPLSAVGEAAGRRLTKEFSLSSTDLFHSPAGTVQLTLSFDDEPSSESNAIDSLSISSEFVILDPARIEFPEINVDKENQQMVSEFFSAPLTHLAESSQFIEDSEMTVNSSESPDGSSFQNSGLFSMNCSVSASEKAFDDSGPSPNTPTSKSGKGDKESAKEEETNCCGKAGERELGSVFKSPLGNINLEEEQCAMQQQIVDMYTRSMQQFTESLAKMKLPLDLVNPKPDDGGEVVQSQNRNNSKLDSNKKDGSRVFYGSRAFF